MSRELAITPAEAEMLAEEYGTPFHLYDETGIRQTARELNQTFSWVSGPNSESYINYYAVKANPNPYILEILAEEGMGADASSGPEIGLASAVGLKAPKIMFTANHVKPGEYKRATDAGATLNLDDTSEIPKVRRDLEGAFPDTISFRYNAGNKKTDGVNDIIGNPETAKFGVPDELMASAYIRAKNLGVEHFGMHTMLASNELDPAMHVATARLLFEKIVQLSQTQDIPFEFANIGGGLGIPYRPGDRALDRSELASGIQEAYEEIILGNDLPPLRVVSENGRYVTGPHGWLIAKVLDVKQGYFTDIGIDSTTLADMPRPALYDAYHHISRIGEHLGEKVVQRVVGGLCEDMDYFAGAKTRTRLMDRLSEGDLLAISDTGAHCRAMGSNYNGKLRCKEILRKMDGSFQLIRRAETEADLFATLDYPNLVPLN